MKCITEFFCYYFKKPMSSSSATRRFVVFLAYSFSALERCDAGFLKAFPHLRYSTRRCTVTLGIFAINDLFAPGRAVAVGCVFFTRGRKNSPPLGWGLGPLRLSPRILEVGHYVKVGGL